MLVACPRWVLPASRLRPEQRDSERLKKDDGPLGMELVRALPQARAVFRPQQVPGVHPDS